MRILAAVLLLAACSPEAAEPKPERLHYAGEGRDRLCISGKRAGFIIYGRGDSNCAATGRIARGPTVASFIPAGDEDCKIPLSFNGNRVSFGPGQPSCAYYCGPGAAFAGKSFQANAAASPAVDFAGDPLC
jgi:hypothetical protein